MNYQKLFDMIINILIGQFGTKRKLILNSLIDFFSREYGTI